MAVPEDKCRIPKAAAPSQGCTPPILALAQSDSWASAGPEFPMLTPVWALVIAMENRGRLMQSHGAGGWPWKWGPREGCPFALHLLWGACGKERAVFAPGWRGGCPEPPSSPIAWGLERELEQGATRGRTPGLGATLAALPTPRTPSACFLPHLPFLSLRLSLSLLPPPGPSGAAGSLAQFSRPGRAWQAGTPQGAPERLLGSETPWNRAQGASELILQSGQPHQSRLRVQMLKEEWAG